jgi:hypothetical protein
VKLDPGTHKGMNLVLALKLGVTRRLGRGSGVGRRPSRRSVGLLKVDVGLLVGFDV